MLLGGQFFGQTLFHYESAKRQLILVNTADCYHQLCCSPLLIVWGLNHKFSQAQVDVKNTYDDMLYSCPCDQCPCITVA